MNRPRAGKPRMRCRLPAAVLLCAAALGPLCVPAPGQEPGRREPLPDRLPWSERMALSEMERRGGSLSLDANPYARWVYETGVFLEGIERVWLRTGNEKYYRYLKGVVDSFVGGDGTIRGYRDDEYNIDNIKTGTLLFGLYRQTKDARYRKAAEALLRQLETHPRTDEGGFWHKKVYPYQMWLDGIYMGAPFYAQFAATFGRPGHFDDVVNQILWMDGHARDSATGLLYHGWDERREQPWADPETGRSKSFWGRAVGWYVMGVADVLDFLPDRHPGRGKLVDVLRDTLRAVARYQDGETGLWYQVLDQGTRPGNYLEASASSMFVYAIAKGIRKNYLDGELLPVARKGYEGLTRELVRVDADGRVHLTGICSVGGLGGKNRRDGSFDYYMSEPVVSNDLKGVGAFILASVEIEQLAGTGEE